MRVPPSLVVMSVVTAVPFGLAIHDTFAGTKRTDELDLTGEKARERRAIADAERMRAQQEAAIEAHDREIADRLDALVGATPGTPGAMFDGVTLGASIDAFQTEDAHERLDDLVRDRVADVSFRGVERLDEIHIDIPYSTCQAFHERLVHRWRAVGGDAWLDPATHIRAIFSVDECALEFSTYLDVEEWVGRLPLDAIGKAIAVDRTMPGVGSGKGYTSVSAERDDSHRVIEISIVGNTDLATQVAIRDALTKRLGTPAIAKSAGVSWNSTPPVELDVSGASRFSIGIYRLWH